MPNEDTATRPDLTWQLHDLYDRLETEACVRLRGLRSAQGWLQGKGLLREAVARGVGYWPELLPRVEAELLGVTQRDGYAVQRLAFHGWPDAPISANLYVPDRVDGPAPAVLAPHGHSADGKGYQVYQCAYINLARRGYIVLAWDMIGYGERQAMGHQGQYWPLLLGLSLKGLLLTEAQALASWLTQQPQVDPRRMGCTGNSGGGAQTLLLAALDTRIAAAAVAGHTSPIAFIAAKEKNLCPCTLLPGLLREAEIEHVLGLIAPRPAMIVSGRDDCLFPDDLVRRAHRLGQRYYELEGVRDRLELFAGACAHGYEQPKREAMYAFFDRTLRGSDVTEVAEPDTAPEPADSPALRCWPGPQPSFCTVRELVQRLQPQLDSLAPEQAPSWGDVLGVDNVPRVTEAAEQPSAGAQGMLLSLSHHVRLPASVMHGPGQSDTVAIVLDPQGMDSRRAVQCSRAAQHNGATAVAVDLLGWGRTRPSEIDSRRGDDETFAAQRGIFLGRSLLGERAADLLAVSEWALQAHHGRSLTWEAFGWAGMVALFAAAAGRPDIGSALRDIHVHGLPIASLWDDLDGGRPLFSFPCRGLALGDLDALAAGRAHFHPSA